MYKFTPPHVYDMPLAYNRLMFRCLTPRGIGVGMIGNQILEFDYPEVSDIESCDVFWRGGYVHYISDDSTATKLINAGYDVVEI